MLQKKNENISYLFIRIIQIGGIIAYLIDADIRVLVKYS